MTEAFTHTLLVQSSITFLSLCLDSSFPIPQSLKGTKSETKVKLCARHALKCSTNSKIQVNLTNYAVTFQDDVIHKLSK